MTHPDKLFGRLGNRMFQMAYIYSQVKKGEIPDIYTQDFNLFKDCELEIKNWFGEGIGYLPYVAIHLRVGYNPTNPEEPAYSDNPFYVNLSKTGYYIDATNLFPGRKFLVFSDNVEFAKTYFEGDKFAFDESESDIDSFNTMASCSDFIIANSSFSSWAAYLSPNVNKKVVAPTYDKWYSDGNTTRTVLPSEWIQV